jgi:hypothetical protein
MSDTTSCQQAKMLTQEGNSLIGGTIEKPPVQRDMGMAKAGEASGTTAQRSRKRTHVSFADASEQWKCNQNGKRLWNKTWEPVSAPGTWLSGMERTARQQVYEATQLHQTIDRMARMLEAHVVRDDVQ